MIGPARIAIIGNSNNFGFSLLRHLVDQGLDAHLFLFAEDGVGDSHHFSPESEQVLESFWIQRIHPTLLSNSSLSALSPWIAFILNFFRKRSCKVKHLVFKRKYLQQLVSPFDIKIGTGVTPAMFYANRLKLDIFFPCSTGVEFANTLGFLNDNVKGLLRLFRKLVRSQQVKGIRATTKVLNAEMGETQEFLELINANCVSVPIPSVHTKSLSSLVRLENKKVANTELIELDSDQLVIFSHVRHYWANVDNLDNEQWERENKHNDWLIKSFHRGLIDNSLKGCLLVLVKYGRDYERSMRLCHDLGIQEHVRWLDLMDRHTLFNFIDSYVDIGVGEFRTRKGTIWGGATWEFLALGKPVLQTFLFSANEFEKVFNLTSPPIVHVENEESLLAEIRKLVNNEHLRSELGSRGSHWYLNQIEEKTVRAWVKEIESC